MGLNSIKYAYMFNKSYYYLFCMITINMHKNTMLLI